MRKKPLCCMGLVLGLWFLAGCASPSGSGAAGRPNVYVTPGQKAVTRVAVLPFRAATELIGASVSDLFVTELMKMQRYELIERGQLSNVLGETEVALSGLTANQAAQLGQMVGADAVIIGTVSEYEMMAQRGHTIPVVGVTVRMIDAGSSRVLWSVDHASRGSRGSSLGQLSRSVVQEMTSALSRQVR